MAAASVSEPFAEAGTVKARTQETNPEAAGSNLAGLLTTDQRMLRQSHRSVQDIAPIVFLNNFSFFIHLRRDRSATLQNPESYLPPAESFLGPFTACPLGCIPSNENGMPLSMPSLKLSVSRLLRGAVCFTSSPISHHWHLPDSERFAGSPHSAHASVASSKREPDQVEAGIFGPVKNGWKVLEPIRSSTIGVFHSRPRSSHSFLMDGSALGP